MNVLGRRAIGDDEGILCAGGCARRFLWAARALMTGNATAVFGIAKVGAKTDAIAIRAGSRQSLRCAAAEALDAEPRTLVGTRKRR
jgi:hypothetical protein